tara:strand:+ start:367 stop:537 length:171 start_codon:yes stop_codon:yes gene_type:complete
MLVKTVRLADVLVNDPTKAEVTAVWIQSFGLLRKVVYGYQRATARTKRGCLPPSQQ